MLDEYKQAVETFAAVQLEPYSAWVAEQYRTRRAAPKEINDPVWGTLTLSGLEVVVLDSPLLQRLRRIKQLGVAHWVYPAATHSRLEHSVGALVLAQRLLRAVNLGDGPIPDHYAKGIRVAALCHDIGHGVMSHVSENALAYVDSTEELRLEFTERHMTEAQLGEINSFLLVGSPAFADLLGIAQSVSGDTIGLPDATTFVQKCIIGARIDPAFPVLHQIVSGPFDADKLDYMTRDAYMSGVPVVTDVNRLIRKVRSTRISRAKTPPPIQRLSNMDTDIVSVIGIDRSGNRTVDELTLGRTLLFDKLYRHHKTRACEAMVTSVLVRIAQAAVDAGKPWEASMLALRLDDDLLMTGAIESSLDGYELSEDAQAVVADVIARLRDRRLFVRAVAFSRKMTSDPYDQDDEQARGLQELLAEIEDPIRRRGVADELAALTGQAIDTLGLGTVVADWPGDLRDYIWVDGVRSAEHLTSSSKAMLVTADGELIPFAAEAPETPQWATAYQQTRDAAFVFCPAEIAVPTALAAERFVREQYGVRLPRAGLVAARRSTSGTRDERVTLAAGGFYDASPAELRPLPARLIEGDVETLLTSVADHLRGYCPPLVRPDRAGHDLFDPARVRDFIQQFETDDLIDTALVVFGGVEIIDRHAVVRPLFDFLAAHPEFEEASLVVFGSAGDSSSIVTYFAMDAGARHPGLRVRELGEALMLDKPILFVDDIIGSGRQSAAIVRAWFGDTGLADELGEVRTVLPEPARSMLAAGRPGFCFAVGLEDGEGELTAALEGSGIGDFVVKVGRQEASLPTIFTAGEVTVAAREAFVSRCEAIGDALLSDQADEKRTERRLGYGNKGLLITFPYNTPSQALTCLWERGVVDGRPWTPLLPRRRKR